MRVEPKLCAVARPEHKGKVERAIRYLRDRFLAGRRILGVAEGNRALARFLDDIAHRRPHPVHHQRTVGDVLVDERRRLLALPEPLPITDFVEPVVPDSQAFVRFDGNRYSLPSTAADYVLTLVADDRTVRLVHGQIAIAEHPRSWGKKQVIEKPEHRTALVAERQVAAQLKGRDRLRAIAPAFDRVLERWVASGGSLAVRVTRAIKLLDLYGDHVFAAAVDDVVARGLSDPGALAMACEKHRKDRRRTVPVELVLPDHIDDAEVIPHDLERYDGKRR